MEKKQQFVTDEFRKEFEKFILLKYTTIFLLLGVIIYGAFQEFLLMFGSFLLMLFTYYLRLLQKQKIGLI